MMTSNFYNNHGQKKQEIRNGIVSFIKPFIDPKRILSLPGRDADCLKTFNKAFPWAELTGVEENPVIYKQWNHLNFNFRQEKMSIDRFSKLIYRNGPFDVIWLDYLSPYTEKRDREISQMIANPTLVDRHRIFNLNITFLKNPNYHGIIARTTGLKTISKKLDLNNIKTQRGYLERIIHRNFRKIIVEKSEIYKNSNKSTEMVLFSFIIK